MLPGTSATIFLRLRSRPSFLLSVLHLGGEGEGELELRCNAHRVFHELFALLNFKKLSPNPFREKTNKAVVIQVPVAN